MDGHIGPSKGARDPARAMTRSMTRSMTRAIAIDGVIDRARLGGGLWS